MTDIELEVAALETAINEVLAQMSGNDCASDEYAKMADQLVKLYKAKETHVNLKLKEVETALKKDESANNIQIKNADSMLKGLETRANIDAKNRDASLKESELELKKAESDTNREVKALDVILKQREVDRPWLPSADSMAVVAANIVGIVMILGHERANVIASKALGFVTKLR